MTKRNCLQKISFWLLGLFLLVVVAVHVPVTAEAKIRYKGQDGGLSWTISDKGKLVIKGSGTFYGYDMTDEDPYKMDEYHLGNAPEWCMYPYYEHVKSVQVLATDLTHLNSFFYGLVNMTSYDVSAVDMSQITSLNHTFCGCGSLESIDLSGWDTSHVQDMCGLFSDCYQMKSVNLTGLDVSQVTDVSYMFSYCSELQDLDLSCFGNEAAKGKLTRMEGVFYECYSLGELNLNDLDVSQVTDMRDLFALCSNLKELHTENWDTSKVENMRYTFSNCESLTNLDLNHWNTSSVTVMEGMFFWCSALEELHIDQWDTSALIDADDMFCQCNSLRTLVIRNWDVRHVESMTEMLLGCESLEHLDLSGWQTDSLHSLLGMFYQCYSLQEVDLSDWNVEKVTGTVAMFYQCTNLQRVKLDGWNLLNNQSMESMFENCENLRELTHLDIYDTGMEYAFKGCRSLNGDITIYGTIPVYSKCFKGTSAEEDAQTLVHYGGRCSREECERIIATQGKTGHVRLGQAMTLGAFANVDCVKEGIRLKWNAMEGADQMIVEKSIDDGQTYETLFQPESNGKGSLTDREVKNGQRYFYRLRVFHGDEEFACIPSYYIYLTPVKLDPSSLKWLEGEVMYMKASRNKKADYYVGYVKRDDSYEMLYPESEPGVMYSSYALKNGKKYSFKIAPAVIDDLATDEWDTRLILGPMSDAVSYYYLETPKIRSLTKVSTGKFRVTWNKNTKASGYQVQLADNRKLTKAKTYKIKNKDTLIRNITKTVPNKKYYVCIRSYKVVGEKTYYSAWCSATKF